MAAAIEKTLAEPEPSENITLHMRQYSWENCASQHARLLESAAQPVRN
jgi:hypothetical protein